ncbi:MULTISPECIES: ABC transporter permease [unclassified Methanoregula]|uniref:ABC transporter permease n=1 Tax=unclassified Methanoregula TaxID=2649730 RepID=UPI0009C75727|nr:MULTISPECIES: FtsX-like permease family protein [unclassified Methanoregula]OPX64100.1 MAG: macrolide transporter ATP-binding /permease protein [Methanoregula sp. PtaB.Bin085]OPY34780.1 MAG: macrolide transporter ATP-binding /permease protein [Methanoregula sp. PtaU1.Bin006]
MGTDGGWRVSLYLAVRAIRRGNRNTLALTVLIIALVIVLMNFLSMIIGGVVSLYNQQMIDFQYGHVAIEPRDRETTITGADAVIRQVQRIPGVTGASARVSTGVTITNPKNGKFQSKALTAFDPVDEQRVTQYQLRMKDGDYLSKGDSGQILIGALLAGTEDEAKDKLPSLGGVKVGDRINVMYSNGIVKSYRVKGIFETEGALIDSGAFITRTEMDSVMHTEGIATEILVRGPSADSATSLKYAIMNYGVGEKVKTWKEKGQGILGDAIASFSLLNTIMTVVCLVVASVVVFIVTFINIINRKKQIAILKAIGIRRQVIVGSYLLQVLFLCSCGIVLGTLMLNGISAFLSVYQLKFPMGYLTPIIDYSGLATSIALLLVVSVISAYLPARQVTDEEILDAMRG